MIIPSILLCFEYHHAYSILDTSFCSSRPCQGEAHCVDAMNPARNQPYYPIGHYTCTCPEWAVSVSPYSAVTYASNIFMYNCFQTQVSVQVVHVKVKLDAWMQGTLPGISRIILLVTTRVRAQNEQSVTTVK